MAMSKEFIKIGGAREHNLKNLTLQIPRDKLVVVTGLSGSGKSSLAFDTIYAEGQRKYVESFPPTRGSFSISCRSRTWISSRVCRRRLPLSSAVPAAARARSSPPRRRFTITCACFTRTSARRIARKPACPFPRKAPATSWTKFSRLPPKTKIMLLAPVVRRQKGEFRDVFERLAREGFVRVRVDGEILELGENIARIKLDKKKFHNIEAVVDRLVIDEKIRVRLGDSVQTALRLGEGVMFTLHQLPEEWRGTMPSTSPVTRHASRNGSKLCTRTKCVRRPRAKVTTRRRRNIFPSTRPPARVRFATASARK
jgi:excinuclease ABC subunit A